MVVIHGGRRTSGRFSPVHQWSFFCFFFFLVTEVRSFYIPCAAPPEIERGEPLKVKVNELTSAKTQLPYSYYSLPYCRPASIVDSAENFGEVLRGNRIENSLYEFRMREPQNCTFVCRLVLDSQSAFQFKEKIDDEYRVNMILDNLPLVIRSSGQGISPRSSPVLYQQGFFVGFKRKETHFINNHLRFTVKFNSEPGSESSRVVGFEVVPVSARHRYQGTWDDNGGTTLTCPSSHFQPVEDGEEVIFTYDVDFLESDVKWGTRWDTYLLGVDDNPIHLSSFVGTLFVVLVLSVLVAVVMFQTVYRDVSTYNRLEADGEATGWKVVQGDVFRAPKNADLLCVFAGTGVQVFATVVVVLTCAALGILSPANRGVLMMVVVLVWVVMGLLAGYSAARLHKSFNGTRWMAVCLKTALMFPGAIFVIFFILNAVIWGNGSSGAVPFFTMFVLLALWFGVATPLVLVGGKCGSKTNPQNPVETTDAPRDIPSQVWFMGPVFTVAAGGVMPFASVFFELFFILTSASLSQFYYTFGLLLLVFFLLNVTCAEVAIVLCYYQLQNGDYHWWWRSYLHSASSAIYVFVFSLVYGLTRLGITKSASVLLFVGYLLIISMVFFVLTGAIGFYASYIFTGIIYRVVNIAAATTTTTTTTGVVVSSSSGEGDQGTEA